MNEPSSFRDPDGFVFFSKGTLYRQINKGYKEDFDFLIKSGLYKRLVDKGLLIPHEELKMKSGPKDYKIIKPTPIPFISYPYEWCFSELKDAALLTLAIQKEAMEAGMSLKDASSFNVQFLSGKPVFIDTLSFEKYQEGKPWVCYRQFCEQFLAPLALFAYKDASLNKLSQAYLGSIPIELADKLLPLSAKLKPALFFHIFLHSRTDKRAKGIAPKKVSGSFSRQALMGLVDSLESFIKGLSWHSEKTIWSEYYAKNTPISYSDESLSQKKKLVGSYLEIIKPRTLWDVGANTGVFSRIAGGRGIFTVSIDKDPLAIEKNYLWVKKHNEKHILPLVIDIVNPTPSIGWENQERTAVLSRPLPDAVLALAVIHHLAIGNNLPFPLLASFFAKLCKSLIIEYVPKEDKEVRLLLQNREDIFYDYNKVAFEEEFSKFFTIKDKSAIPDSGRILYLMVKKGK